MRAEHGTQAHDRKQASLVQLTSRAFKNANDAFIPQDPEEGLAVRAPEANTYAFQSCLACTNVYA